MKTVPYAGRRDNPQWSGSFLEKYLRVITALNQLLRRQFGSNHGVREPKGPFKSQQQMNGNVLTLYRYLRSILFQLPRQSAQTAYRARHCQIELCSGGIITSTCVPAHSTHEHAQSSLPPSPLYAGDHQLFGLCLSPVRHELS